MSVLFTGFTLFLAACAAAAPLSGHNQIRHVNHEHLRRDCASVPPPNIGIRNQIVSIACSMGVNDKVMLSMMETAITESNVNNLPCGDRESVGVYQQQPQDGWGTKAQCMNVTHATIAYLNPAIQADIEHPNWTADEIAQSVQEAVAGNRYGGNQGQAEQFIAEAKAAGACGGSAPKASPSPTSGGGAVNVENAPNPSKTTAKPKSTGGSSSGKCKQHYTPVGGDYCIKVAKKFNISLADFYAWNPSISNPSCNNLEIGVSYCVGE